ncbi:integral peroxisomal membrane peroxin-domain-containing protein [Xylariaceae sp. FL1272]|nr:integral peroxisomal membrane peroxin-domain-containing protein [Xylariaceae sp. FL1272]
MTHMSTPKSTPRADVDSANPSTIDLSAPPSYAPPTYASFSPAANLSATSSAAKRRSTILVHQKSPLLLATPPQITRALAYSHPFLLPLNKLVGLLSWTTGDPWESFLLLASFWAVVLYGDAITRFAGPIVVVAGIIAGMYARRYSPLSSSGWAEHPSVANGKDKNKGKAAATGNAGAGQGHQRNTSEATSTRHQKTLDEMVDTLKIFTTRCNILLEPLLEMTDFLSTQRTATSATVRPALTTLFVRIMAVTPIWIALTLPPLRIITTRRIVLIFGTLVISWHCKVCRVSRTLLWRSATIRKLARAVTGLQFERPVKKAKEGANGKAGAEPAQTKQAHEAAKLSTSALTQAIERSRSGLKDSGVRFTFILYENQRRWVGLGWTNSLFAYERSAWTDEQNNAVPPKDEFELPEVEDGRAKWRWVEGSKWRVDGVPDMEEPEFDAEAGKMGWIYYDNKWQNGRRGADGWGRWTRRRKWYRDAELVEISEEELHQESREPAASPPPPALPARPQPTTATSLDKSDPGILSSSNPETVKSEDDAASIMSTSSKSARFRMPTPSLRKRPTNQSQRGRRASETASLRSNEEDSTLDPALELEIQGHRRDQGQWGIGDEAQMGLE